MAQKSEQARLIASLTSKGYSTKDIAALTGRSPRYVTLARDSVEKVGRGGKVSSGRGQNLIPLLKELNTKGKVSPASIPERRTTKGGKVARVRKGSKTITTKKGVQHTVTNVKKGPATLKKTIEQAAKDNKRVRWDVNFKKVKTKSDRERMNAWTSGHLPSGWNAQELLDRINNPQEGDTWKAGDVNGALSAIAVEQNAGGITSASGAQEYNLFTAD